MRKNDIVEIVITGMTDDGDGVGRVDNLAVFVPYTIVGETVRAVIVKVLKRYAYGKLLEVVRPSEHRIKAECEYFYQCGGCSLWHMSYESECEYKRNKVEDCLRRIGGIDVEVSETVKADSVYGYRNKNQFPVTPDGIGMYARRSHRLIKTEGCLIAAPFCKTVTETVGKWMKDFGVTAYDEKTGAGTVRNVYTRSGDKGILVCIVTSGKKLPHSAELTDALLDTVLDIAGIVQNINPKKTNTILGNKTKTIYGDGVLEDGIGDVRFKISPLSFYQVNKEQTLKLYGLVKEFLGLSGGETVWDIYCGIGTIGQFIAKDAKRIVGVEIVPDAVDNAKENAGLNGIANADYYCGKAEELASGLLQKYGRPDAIILDPPRKGCDEQLLKTVCDSGAERVVYVSCKPSTLARDLRYLEDNGYKTVKAVPVDMFPRTAHVETVVLMSRVKD